MHTMANIKYLKTRREIHLANLMYKRAANEAYLDKRALPTIDNMIK